MDSKEMESIRTAIQQIKVERGEKKLFSSSEESNFIGDDHHLLLSGLLPQLETLNGEGKVQQPEPPINPTKEKSDTANEAESGGGDDSGRVVEIIRELKKVQKQNFITHCLLSVMIALTVTWQLSEFTLVLKVKDGLSHPFKSFGSMMTGMIKGRIENVQIVERRESGTKHHQIEGPSIPPLKIPGVPQLDFPLGLNSDKH